MRVLLSFVLLSFTIPLPVEAQATAPVPTLPLQQAVDQALAHNPGIQAAVQRLAALRERPLQARSLPDPMVSAGYNASGWPYPGAGLGKEPTANIGLSIRQDIPYPGKRQLRATLADREADTQAIQLEATRRSIASRVKQAYFRLAYTYAAGDVLARNRALLDTLLQVSETRYGVGQAAQQDVFKAQAELSILEVRQERLRHERLQREAELNLLLASAPGSPLGRPESLEFHELEPTIDVLLAGAREQAPFVRRERANVDRAQVAIDAAKKDYKPDFAVEGGYFTMGSMPPMWEFRFDVAVPMQRARRAAAVREQVALRAEAERVLEATGRDVEEQVHESFHMATTASRLARLYRDSLLPTFRLALDSSLSGYQSGRVDFLAVLTNFASLFEYEMAYFDQLADFHVAASRLEEMTGIDLAH